MFRQILVREEDRNFQRILWREDKNMPVKEYTLNTVTYGTGPATYLSVRCLQELANQEELNFPKASKTLREDFYVDDLMTDAKTINEARQLQKDLINLLAKGGFNLRKWVSNTAELTAHLQPDQRAIPENIQIGTDEHIKALGIEWNQRTDEFTFSLNPRDYHGITKRQLLPSIASIFDPIGWLAPITVRAKILMQELWNQELNWDDPTPSDTQKEWSSLMIELRQLDSVRIPRWIHTNNTTQLHGFCDASQKAYAAVVYTRSVDEQGRVHIHLIAAKTKVAPLKNKVTLPRLELNAAVLLANLLHNVLEALQINKPEVYAWSDSEITLAWIAKPPTTWETYIANRVSKVQNLIPQANWNHVRSAENPADAASRGIKAEKLLNDKQWWNGPTWLKKNKQHWPIEIVDEHYQAFMAQIKQAQNTIFTLDDFKTAEVTALIIETPRKKEEPQSEDENITRFSSLTHLIRVTALLKRFFNNLKNKAMKKTGKISDEEYKEAKTTLIRRIQETHFKREINCLQKNQPIPSNSKILSLSPFLELRVGLRVGGRLQHSNLDYDAKHQIILPKNSHFTKLIIQYTHDITLHGGTQLMLNTLRQEYWIIYAKSGINKIIHKCLACFKQKATQHNQLMGNLPDHRVRPSAPFTTTGIDYAGPFSTKCSKTRGIKTYKGYIALFVCLATKATHLEYVSDLSTEAFLAALKRFIARRGKP
ncbi:uncharacterized protein LOC129808445 [Phlebotomus papatasi]|uniref:uncharacterized protein LOC129808445 n=1 Tax=Phlebotomus papatasi TaxID=29031 RepID=UPI002483F9CA|nr:uncharacterized protein LOC129808445 [Phlebotomus papatasi]